MCHNVLGLILNMFQFTSGYGVGIANSAKLRPEQKLIRINKLYSKIQVI